MPVTFFSCPGHTVVPSDCLALSFTRSAACAAIFEAITPSFTSSTVGSRKMLRRRDIAEKVRAACRRDGPAYCRSNMIITGRYIRYQRPEHIVRRIVAHGFLKPHILGYHIKRYMPRPFNDCLHSPLSSPFVPVRPRIIISCTWPLSPASLMHPGRRPSPRLITIL